MLEEHPSRKNTSVADHFDELAEEYRTHFSAGESGKTYLFRKRALAVAQIVEATKGRLLDCACGSGEVAALALEGVQCERATLVDISEKMLTMAKAAVGRGAYRTEIQFVNGDVFEYLARVDESEFDVILCTGLIAHTGGLTKLLPLLARALSSRGMLVMQTSVATHLGVAVVRACTEWWIEHRRGYKLSYYTIPELRRAAASAGLGVEEVIRYGLGIPFGDRLFPRTNYWLETQFEPLAARVGEEALLVMRKPG